MIEAILLQIPPLVGEVLQICTAYHCDHLMYAKHVLLHHIVIPLLDLIQSPYHGIIIVLVAECPLHVHQQVPHRDVLALSQCACPFSWVPIETGEDVGVHTSLIILLEEGIYIKAPEHVIHFHPWITRFKDLRIQSCRHKPFPYSHCGLCTYVSSLQSHLQWSIHQSVAPPCLGKRGANPLH